MSDTYPSAEAQSLVLRYGPPEVGLAHWFSTIHPLAPAGAEPTVNPELTLVDLYWAFGKDAFFVSVVADPSRPISATFTPTKGEYRGDFFVLSGGASLTGRRVDSVLAALASWIRAGADLERQSTINLANLQVSDSPPQAPRD